MPSRRLARAYAARPALESPFAARYIRKETGCHHLGPPSRNGIADRNFAADVAAVRRRRGRRSTQAHNRGG